MLRKCSESVHLCEAGCGFERQISKQILRGSGGGCTGTANPLTAQYIQTHLANTPEPHSPNILCTNENLAGFTPPSLEWSPETQPALAPAPPSPPPLAKIRVAAPLPFYRVEAPGAVVIPVYQDTDHVYQDKGFLMVKAVMPQENGDRVRVAYNEVVWCVTGTFPPQHSNTGQRSLHCQKGLVDFLLPLGVKAMPSSVTKGLVLAYIKWPDIAEGVQWNVNGCREEPVLRMEPEFEEKIEAIKKACEMLETRGTSACVSNEFCVRVYVPPSDNSYVVRLMLEVQRLRKNNSACRPAGGRNSVGRVDKLVEADKRKQMKRVDKLVEADERKQLKRKHKDG
ncbi:g11453 [Coccomyxa elongata]